MYEEKAFQYNGYTIPYLIDYPAEYSPDKKYPVIVYLHGYGFVLRSVQDLKNECPIQRTCLPANTSCILIAPKCSEKNWLFHFESLSAFFDEIAASSFCDASRLYLCGTSMGAYAAWIVLMEKQNFFAASVLCCGGGPYWGAEFYVGTPIRLVHGKKDTTVFFRESELMALTINAKGGNVELIAHETLDHNVWTVTFTDPDTYHWLLSHSRA